ncbi:MAG: glycosyltransferase, partial [Lacipirellulaceae bacterium]
MDGRSRYAVDVEGRPLAEKGPRMVLRPLERWRQRQRIDQLEAFVAGCEQVFAKTDWDPADRVFLPTLGEFDLLGLIRFLRTHPESVQLDWHMQFHFDAFKGRETEHASQQERQLRFDRQINFAKQAVPDHKFHFYATTEAMCRQYNRLGIGDFQHLPYPVGEVFRKPNEKPTVGRPLRVSCAGMVRREKYGYSLTNMLSDTADLLQQGDMQLAVQINPKRVRRHLGKAGLARATVSDCSAAGDRSPVVVVKHPLTSDEYEEFIRGSDVGLFLYDSDRYHSRASGILLEMLSAGVPVIVPGGCWLSEQIQGEQYCHARHLLKEAKISLDANLPSIWKTRDHGRVASATVAIPESNSPTERKAVLSWNWDPEQFQGQYVRITVRSIDESGNAKGDQQVSLCGVARDSAIEPAILINVPKDASYLNIELSNAYANRMMELDHLELSFINSASDAPTSRVGLIAAEPQQIPLLLREMLNHYQHYIDSARSFALQYGEQHSPERTLEILQANTHTTRLA